ncbi:MAG: hypothetical protein PF572_05045 [Patescibacteria group bacterium]|jgi:hypothetical protein|nr:hypothetical protein [Patescibacteria group bacterium]
MVITKLERDGKLVNRFFPIIIIGAERVLLENESKMYIRILVRLIDKACDEYSKMENLVNDELQTGDKLANRFNIINHLENCINAINRAMKVVNRIFLENREGESSELSRLVTDNDLADKVRNYSTSSIRNRIEHIDEDIYERAFRGNLFLDIDENYEKICINGTEMLINDLVGILQDYHQFVVHIFSNLPNKIEGGKCFRDDEEWRLST